MGDPEPQPDPSQDPQQEPSQDPQKGQDPQSEPSEPASEPSKPSEPSSEPSKPSEPSKGSEPSQEPTETPLQRAIKEIEDEDLRKHAERFTDVQSLVKANLDSRKKLSQAIVPPGDKSQYESEEAYNEAVADYRKKLGIPETPDGYEIKRPENLPDELKPDDDDNALEKTFIERMHAMGATQEQVQEAINWYWQTAQEIHEAQITADEQFADEADKQLRKEWGKDYDKNKEFANSFLRYAFGDAVEDARHMEMKNGRFLLDHPLILKAFAKVGRAMGEDTLGPTMTDDEKKTTQEKIDYIHELQHSKPEEYKRRQGELNQLYQQLYGTEPVVGGAPDKTY